MNRTWKTILLLTIAVAAGSCAQPETEEPVADTAPDPTVVDPDHYKTEFENDQVRILRINYGPGEESVMHYHPDAVAVFLTPHHVQFTAPDGMSEEVHAEAGEAIFTPAGQHLPKNVGDEPLELVLVELKAAPQPGEAGPDPTEVDAGHYVTESENDRVRIVRINYGPGEESVMHYHPDSVAVFLTPHHVQFTAPDGTSQEVEVEAGTHMFTPAEQHLPKNLGEEPLELVLVELK